MKNIYVGNLSYNTTADDLSALFQQHGDVAACRVISDRETQRSKGFAFVEMPNEDEAEAAIAAIADQEFMGRNLKVNEARPREDRR